MSNELRERLHELSTELPHRDAGGRGEELASEAIGDMFVELGLQTDIDGFNCPEALRINRIVYMLLLVIASVICYAAPGLRGLSILLAVIGLVLMYLSFSKTDPFASVLSKTESQNVIGRYSPKEISNSPRRSKIVITAYYDVQRPSIFQMPALRAKFPILRKVFAFAGPVMLICCIVCTFPLPDVATLIFSIIGLVGAVIMVLAIIDQFLGSILKPSKGANCNASGLAVMMALAQKVVTAEVRPTSTSRGSMGTEGAGAATAAGVAMLGDDEAAYTEGDLNWLDAPDQNEDFEGVDVDSEVNAGRTEDFDAVSPDTDDTFTWDYPEPAVGYDSEFAMVAALARKRHEREMAEQKEGDEQDGETSELGSTSDGAPAASDAQVLAAGSDLYFVDSPEVVAAKLSSAQEHKTDAMEESARSSEAEETPATEGSTPASIQKPSAVVPVPSAVPAPAIPAAALQATSASTGRAKSKPSWWTKVEEEKERGEIGQGDSGDLTLRSRFADAPAYAEPEEPVEEPAEEEVAEEAPTDVAESAPIDADASSDESLEDASAQLTQPAQPMESPAETTPVSQDEDASSSEDAANAPVEESTEELAEESTEEPVDSDAFANAADTELTSEIQLDAADTELTSEIQLDVADAKVEPAPTPAAPSDPSATMAFTPDPISDSDKVAEASVDERGGDDEQGESSPVQQDIESITADLREMLSGGEGARAIDIPSVDIAHASDTQIDDAERGVVRDSLLNLPLVGSGETEITMGGESLQPGLDLTELSDRDMRIDSSFGQSNLTGAFAPLDASGVMPAVTSEMLEQYNDGDGDIYIDDVDDSLLDAQYNDEGTYVGTVPMDEPRRKGRFSLFGGRKEKKSGRSRRRRRDEGYDQSAAEWLGVSDDYNARSEGAEIGSWDNFDDDDPDWRGGAYGGTEAANRNAIDMLSDELLNKEIWFVALGASGASGAGMRNLLKTRSSELRHARIINLEAIGAGDLYYTAYEPKGIFKRRVDSRMQRLVEKSASDAKVDIEPVDLSWRNTQATVAMDLGARAITLISLDEGTVPGWRWTDDTEDIVSDKNLEGVFKLLIELLKNC